ncbi:MAG: hypothetical protein KGJ23_02670 [Euryarchaeota archaeon]|nr:hypothetical protein [Euryarchaeota archaeon]MDE1835501.1 hypothetical protein [Euryarchaeota archaeon]MDE2045782.1 hypothetical protein [Thermoplasmata archaeon]
MTTIKTLAAYEVVQHEFPRPPPTEKDEIGRATGKAIDHALSQWSHQHRQNLRPTAASVQRTAKEVLDEELRDADVVMTVEQRSSAERQIAGVLQAFRKSPVFGLARPRSRMVLVNGEVGVYAQPDYWDGGQAFYEMKAYRAVPPPPDVALQVRIFQLAFPGMRSFLACFDRHHDPVETVLFEVPPATADERSSLLELLLRVGRELGHEKVLEYVDVQKLAYSVSVAQG